MREDIQNLKNEALAQIMEARSREELEELRVAFLGRNGKVNEVFKDLKNLSVEEKREVGQSLNEVKKAIEEELEYRKSHIKENSTVSFDPTVPGIKQRIGHLHLVTQAIEEITQVFKQIGFTRVRYPDAILKLNGIGKHLVP
jgi:phenylalanyl-tRNA synthetase alpha chain